VTIVRRREKELITVKDGVRGEREKVTWQTTARARETSQDRRQNHNSWKKQKLFKGRT
jgi:hypothetical protein